MKLRKAARRRVRLGRLTGRCFFMPPGMRPVVFRGLFYKQSYNYGKPKR